MNTPGDKPSSLARPSYNAQIIYINYCLSIILHKAYDYQSV